MLFIISCHQKSKLIVNMAKYLKVKNILLIIIPDHEIIKSIINVAKQERVLIEMMFHSPSTSA